MREIDDIKAMIAPFMKRLPLIILILIFVGYVVNQLLNYKVPMYDAEMKMRLDNMNNSFTSNNLYKDFDVLTSTDKVLTEVEVIKSDLIVYKALEAMSMPVSYYRIGKLITTEIYPDAPFIVTEDSSQKVKRDLKYQIEINVVNNHLSIAVFDQENIIQVIDGERFLLGGVPVKIIKNDHWIAQHGLNNVIGKYEFCFNSLHGLKASFVDDNLLVKAVDKDIDVIRINFSNSNPQKAADFVNKMGESYVSDYLSSKAKAATLTSQFIATKIARIKKDLIESETKLEKYRVRKQVLDSKQELDIGLKKVSQLDQQLANLELKKITMDSLMKYVEKESEKVQKYAPSFEAYGGLLFVELMKKYQSLLGDKKMLLSNYTLESEEIGEVNFKIEQTKSYIQQSIVNHKKLVDYQYESLKSRVKTERDKFNDLPVKERNFLVLQREFEHLESMYNFLTRKKMEADIAKTANLTFHKVIQKARVPKASSSPNASFVIVMAVFSAFLIIVFLIYVVNYFGSKINSKNKSEDILGDKIKMVIPHDYAQLKTSSAMSVSNEILENLSSQKVIGVVSCKGKEGKTFFIKNIIHGLGHTKLRVFVFSSLNFSSENVSCGTPQDLLNFKTDQNYRASVLTNFDLIIIELNPIQNSNDALTFFPFLDHTYFINRFEQTKWSHLKLQNDFIKNYNISNYSIVLNGYSPFSNYMGFISSDNRYTGATKSLVEKVIFCKEWYKSLWIS